LPVSCPHSTTPHGISGWPEVCCPLCKCVVTPCKSAPVQYLPLRPLMFVGGTDNENQASLQDGRVGCGSCSGQLLTTISYISSRHTRQISSTGRGLPPSTFEKKKKRNSLVR
jgi:hypothetical protein